MSELNEFLVQRMKQHPKSCLMENDESYTYQEVLNKMEALSNREPWSSLGKRKCAVLCKNTIHMAIAMLTLWRVDSVVIPLSMNYGKKHCENILEATEVDYIILDSEELVEQFFRLEDAEQHDNLFFVKLHEYREEPELENVPLIMCTSGTTGKPKGVVISEKGLIQNILGIADYFELEEIDRILIARPLYHCAVLTGEFLISLYFGLNIVFYSEVFNPINIKRMISKHSITVMCGTPTLMHHLALMNRRGKEKSTLRVMAVSGECLTSQVMQTIKESFPETKLYNVYGLTEASPRVSYLPYTLSEERVGSVGVPLIKTFIKIVDEQGNEVEGNQRGEILVKSPSLMKGYYGNPDATAKKIVDGWLHTGDMGYKDNDGYLYVISRADDMIIKAGMNIYPMEIENEIVKLPEVKEALIYGMNNGLTEDIIAEIVLEPAFEGLDKKQLMAKLSNVLPTYQMPASIKLVEALKRNGSGKVVRPRG